VGPQGRLRQAGEGQARRAPEGQGREEGALAGEALRPGPGRRGRRRQGDGGGPLREVLEGGRRNEVRGVLRREGKSSQIGRRFAAEAQSAQRRRRGATKALCVFSAFSAPLRFIRSACAMARGSP